MTATCHPLPRSVAEEMLQTAARAICGRPGETPAQRDVRTHQLVQMIMAMQPRDGLEYMLSILAVGHFNLILDTMGDVFTGQSEATNARPKTAITALDRSFLGLLREFRTSRKRPTASEQQAKPKEPVNAAPEIKKPPPAKAASPSQAPANGLERAPPVPKPATPTQPPKNILLHPQSAPDEIEQTMAEIEGKLKAVRAREKEIAAAGD